jgi:hypothetical protein
VDSVATARMVENDSVIRLITSLPSKHWEVGDSTITANSKRHLHVHYALVFRITHVAMITWPRRYEEQSAANRFQE